MAASDFEGMWRDLAPVGRSASSGGYFRQPWTSAESELRAWFAEACADRGLTVETDGIGNQVACAAARMVYVMCGTDDEGVEKLKELGKRTYDAMLRLPEVLSTKPKRYDPELKKQVDMVRLSDDFYTVSGGKDDEGAVIVSHTSDRVDFWEYLADRTVNLIPVESTAGVTGSSASGTCSRAAK